MCVFVCVLSDSVCLCLSLSINKIFVSLSLCLSVSKYDCVILSVLPMDRYVPPTNFWGPRFYRKIMPENCLKWDQKPVSTVEKSPIFVLKPVFTMLQTKSRPAFRDFCGENPARTGGTYLSDLIGECPPPPGAGRRMHFRDVSTCGVCMCFCVCGFVKKFWRVIQNYFQLKKQVPQTLPHILPHILPHMGYPTLWPDPWKRD